MTIDTLQQQWQHCQAILADNLTTSAYQTWFAPIVPLQFENGELMLQVKSQFVVDYIEENYLPLLSSTIYRVYGQGTRLVYRVLVDSTSGAGTMLPSSAQQTNNVQPQMPSMPVANTANTFDPQLNPLYTFDTFVAGEPNKLARTAGVAVAKQPGYTAFNPLFIYGGSGVGKTHLANAIGNQARVINPHARVLYVSANTFKLQYQDATKSNRIPDFLNFYQSVDVLIVDDIQYFAGLKGTQDTFFHIFNYLQQSRKQLIFTSDRAPVDLKDIEDRLLTRFKYGLTAEIARPDYQLRHDILRSKMLRDGIQLSDEVVDFIAQNVRDSVRDLEGILASLLAHSTLTDREIDLQLAEQVVSHIVAIQPQETTVRDVMEAVAEHYNIPEKALMAQNRSRDITQARHVAVYLSKQLTKSSLAEIGFQMGRRTHATVLHSISIVRDQLEYDPVMRQHIAQLQATLRR
ncbi:MAG: chromosomal replication initiator protein DnaA [Paludibacteraceae bacterium]|nr:chromosomal replication initiator protein DnaA [Paludibacteraceae bacterium]